MTNFDKELKTCIMKKYIIVRTIPGAGQLDIADLSEISKKSCAAVRDLGKPYHWVQTFVAGDKMYCIHIAPDEDTVRKHSDLGCFPVDSITEISHVIDAST